MFRSVLAVLAQPARVVCVSAAARLPQSHGQLQRRFIGSLATAPVVRLPEARKQTKTPMDMIAEIPPIEIDGTAARCDGAIPGQPGLGHPVEFIQLNKVHPGEAEICKYCGLRFVMKRHGDAHAH